MSHKSKIEPWQQEVADRFINDPRELPCDEPHYLPEVGMVDGVKGGRDVEMASLHPNYRRRLD